MLVVDRIDVFFCSVPGREDVTLAGLASWGARPGIRILEPNLLGVSAFEFQKERRVWAEKYSTGPYYVVTDDDCVPPLGEWLSEATAIMDRHPEFAILSLMPENATIQRWTPENYDAFEDDEVMEHIDVGGVRVCRKGMLTEWPEQTKRTYDREQCTAIRDKGFRCGYYRHITQVHLGEGRTSLR